ncbi:NAD(P)-dependent oxidoreductase [Agromyces silvae]|uniref:NAD(P)-dependent oxidoreductase n=1 Tax=Agromyces silvae TaxID=3388266 RepID=UPI00280B073C|nr:NAD(P)-dependent oxidoreductase [Agromyces protaetiae]
MTEHEPSTARPAVGVIGLGNMGLPIALNMVRAGFGVIGADVSSERLGRLEQAGGRRAETTAELAGRADVIVLLLPDSKVVTSVVTAPAFVASLRPGTVIVDMSSSEPMRTRELGEALREHGVSMVDAPVSGGVKAAVAARLTIMAGGDADDLAVVRPVLDALGTVTHTGALGSGHALKAINNLLSATHLWATSEAMVLGEQFGLDPAVMLTVLNGSSGRSGSTENKWPNFILPGTFDSGFALRLMLKDVRTAVALADEIGVPGRMAQLTESLWAEASDGLAADADHTEIARWVTADAASTGPDPR